MKTIRAEIVEAIQGALYMPGELLREEMRVRDAVIDSIDLVEVMVILNTRFNVPLDPQSMTGIETVGDLVDYVLTHEGEAAGTPSLGRF